MPETKPELLFAGSRTRHGTASGWTRHVKFGERPCDPCYQAKSEYDKRWREASGTAARNRLRATAQRRAYQVLAHESPQRYQELYAAFCAELLGGDA